MIHLSLFILRNAHTFSTSNCATKLLIPMFLQGFLVFNCSTLGENVVARTRDHLQDAVKQPGRRTSRILYPQTQLWFSKCSSARGTGEQPAQYLFEMPPTSEFYLISKSCSAWSAWPHTFITELHYFLLFKFKVILLPSSMPVLLYLFHQQSSGVFH